TRAGIMIQGAKPVGGSPPPSRTTPPVAGRSRRPCEERRRRRGGGRVFRGPRFSRGRGPSGPTGWGAGRRLGAGNGRSMSVMSSATPTAPRVPEVKVQVETLDPCRRQIVIEAPEAEVQAAWEVACDQIQRNARLPGFRRGKVPRALVRTRFADEVRRTVLETLVPAVYRRAVDEARLDPVDDPDLKDLQLQEGQPLRFTAVVEIKPAILLGEYKGVTVRYTPRTVGEADVEGTLAGLADSR